MRRRRLVAAALSATLLLGACGDSPEDKAHNDGKKVGEATRTLFDSSSAADAKTAAKDLRNTINGVGDEVRKTVRTQLATQRDTLQRAVQGVKQGDVAQVKDSVQQIRAQADAFSHSNDSVANEFWRGFKEGYDG
jgi:ABC-type glycerol-3-phosphate transport system substrate-binding protein